MMPPPDPWLLELLARFREDPVIDLDRVDQPSHVLVQGIFRGLGPHGAIVEYELISGPPPPTSVPYGGDFEGDVTGASDRREERPWFVFDRRLSFERNIARLRAQARGSITALGKRGEPPLLDAEAMTAGGHTQALVVPPVMHRLAQAAPPPEPPPPEPPPSPRGEALRPSQPPSAPDGSAAPVAAPPRPPSRPAPRSGPLGGGEPAAPRSGPASGPATGPPRSQPAFRPQGRRPSAPPPEPPPPPPLHGSGPPPSGPARPASGPPPQVPRAPKAPTTAGPPPRRASGPPPAPRRGSVPPPPPEPPPPPGLGDHDDG